MKRLLSLVLLLGTCVGMGHLKAQNVQVLYDTGRNCVTSTVEMFRPDSFGSTYFFTDIDYNPNACGAYWEIARELCFWQDSKLAWLSAHLEYNGELELSANFVAKGFHVMPAVGAKWTF